MKQLPRTRPTTDSSVWEVRRVRRWRGKRFVVWVPYRPTTFGVIEETTRTIWSREVWLTPTAHKE